MRDPDLLSQFQKRMLPNDNEISFLRTCLLSTELALLSWKQWLQQHPQPIESLGSHRNRYRRMCYMLHSSLTGINLDNDKQLLTFLHLGVTHENARTTAYWQICGEVIAALQKQNIQPALCRGAALALLAYPDIRFRHSHNIDILVPVAQIPSANAILQQLNFTTTTPSHYMVRWSWTHPSGLDINLHTYEDALLTKTLRTVPINDLLIPVLSPELLLIYLLQQLCLGSSNLSLFPFCDFWYLVHRNIDWQYILTMAKEHRVSLVLYLMLSFTEQLTQSAIPDQMATTMQLCKDAAPSEYLQLLQSYGISPSIGNGIPFTRQKYGAFYVYCMLKQLENTVSGSWRSKLLHRLKLKLRHSF